jgi:hypothetical protein
MTTDLLNRLPTLAKYLAGENWHDIDDPAEHEPSWHQWGVLGHTRQVWSAMVNEAPIFCLAWGLPSVQELKTEHVQDKNKWKLLLAACILHDLGKWAGRMVKESGGYSFKGHETISEQLIRHDPQIRQALRQAQLSFRQIDYVASIAGLHYELGKLRQLGYEQGHFDLSFLQSALFRTECQAIARRHPAYVREIGLIFLSDSLAKVEFRAGLESLSEIERKIKVQGLSPKLIRAAQQLPLNIALCREYMLQLKYHQ